MNNQEKQERALHIEILRQMLTLATSGFGLVAALAWNNVIKELIDVHIKPYLPFGGGVVSLFVYAFIVTVIAVTVTYQLSKLIKQLERFESTRK